MLLHASFFPFPFGSMISRSTLGPRQIEPARSKVRRSSPVLGTNFATSAYHREYMCEYRVCVCVRWQTWMILDVAEGVKLQTCTDFTFGYFFCFHATPRRLCVWSRWWLRQDILTPCTTATSSISKDHGSQSSAVCPLCFARMFNSYGVKLGPLKLLCRTWATSSW